MREPTHDESAAAAQAIGHPPENAPGAAHTPGPWTATESHHKQEWSHWIESGEPSARRLVAAVGMDNLRVGACDANARLIAAAPALLAACAAFVQWHDDIDEDNDENAQERYDSTLKLCRAAIALATT